MQASVWWEKENDDEAGRTDLELGLLATATGRDAQLRV